MLNLTLQKDGSYFSDKLLANGKLGFGINTFDLTNLSWDRNGIYKAEVFLNGKSVFGYQFNTYSFDEMRYINALIDYPRYKNMGQRVQKLFMKTPFPLSIINPHDENGVINATQNTNQICRIEVSDFNNNKTLITIPIENVMETPLDTLKVKKTKYFIKTNKEYNFEKGNWSFYIPKGTFYDDFYLNFEEKENALLLDNETIPVHSNFVVSVIDSISSQKDKEKMFIGSIQDNKTNYNYTKLKENTFTTYTKNWGKFVLVKDTIAPTVKINKTIEGKWISDKKNA